MACEEPPPKKRLLDTGQGDCTLGSSEDCTLGSPPEEERDNLIESSLLISVSQIHEKLEECFSQNCLCGVLHEDIETYIQLNQTRLPSPSSPALDPVNSKGKENSIANKKLFIHPYDLSRSYT